ncbi:MAG: hypothetical protein ACI4IR_00295 [Eubacterium sp.]
MKNISKFISIMLCALLVVIFSACNKSIASSINTNNEATEEYTSSLRDAMDKKLENISESRVLAKVNDTEIRQVNIDMLSSSTENPSLEEVVKMYVFTDYAENNSISMQPWNQSSMERIEKGIESDSELSNEYCLQTYGISKEDVIKYRKEASYVTGMSTAVKLMISDEIDNGTLADNFPELEQQYKKFNKEKNRDKAWDEIEQAFYEMVAEDYDIVIY